MEELWGDLQAGDAERGYRAVSALVRSPGQAAALLRQKVAPATAEDDRDLSRWIEGSDRHQPIYFLTAMDPGRVPEATVSDEGNPVVFAVPAWYGRVWLVAFGPGAHGGFK